MKHRLLANTGERTFALIFDAGDAVIQPLKDFAAEQGISGARMTAIGAFSTVHLGYFDTEKKEYVPWVFDEQVEVLSFIGDIARDADGQVVVHAHVVAGRQDFSTIGGHLLEAVVRPTLEVTLTETPAYLHRRFDPDSGLALIAL